MNESDPQWSKLIDMDSDWSFCRQKLFHKSKKNLLTEDVAHSLLHCLVVSKFYGVTRTNKASRRAIANVLHTLDGEKKWGLNIGSANTTLHKSLINLDLYDAPNVDIISNGGALPFHANTLDVVVAQEVLEHVEDPFRLVADILRVLKPGGVFYCQVPFVIGYHPGPTDFWRFTKESFHFIFSEKCWNLEQVGPSLGHGSGLYRILVEFCAVTASCFSNYFYKPVKGLAAIICSPLKLFDLLVPSNQASHRIPGGYYCVVRKK